MFFARRFPRPGLEGVPGVANSGAGAQRAGASLQLWLGGQESPPRWVVRQGRGSGHGQTAYLRGTKVGLTPSAAGRLALPGAAREEPRVPPGPRGGGGGEPGRPLPRPLAGTCWLRPQHGTAAGRHLPPRPSGRRRSSRPSRSSTLQKRQLPSCT